MKRLLTLTVLTLVVVTFSVGGPAADATPDVGHHDVAVEMPTHNYDNASYLYCSAHKLAGTNMDHSWPVWIVNGWVGEHCMIHDPSLGWQWCYGVKWRVSDGYSVRTTSYYTNCPWEPHEGGSLTVVAYAVMSGLDDSDYALAA